ncbi:MAG: biotin--[acetyl-CoA-carboxylase] ligase [Elusimicrobia bacterium]|nr:biotin--[acetyl-CoA-carboxylase] ligase [Elusimicrobiota bacterium]
MIRLLEPSVESRLLSSLRAATGGFVSGSRLAAELGLTRAAVHKHACRLRARGFEVSGTNRMGYRLGPSPNGLDLSAVQGPLGNPSFHFQVISSTQEEAKRRALQGAAEGTLVVADRQTAGRGRLGRRWESPFGGLWYSLVLHPVLRPGQVPGLVLVAAMDWVRVIRRETGVPALVKWPNDVWVEGRKLAGILTEMSSEIDRIHWVVMGIGLNLNNPPPRRTVCPAASLSELTGAPVPRQKVLTAWLQVFSKSYKRFLSDGFSAFRVDFDELSIPGENPQVLDFS